MRPVGDGFADEVGELVLEERVQTGGRFVEDQQVGAVHERQHEADLLPVALGQRVDRAVQLGVEALGELVAVAAVAQAADRGEPVQVLAPGQPSGRARVRPAGSRRGGGSATLSRDGSRPEDAHAARCRSVQTEQQSDRGRLPGAVRAEEPEHFPGAISKLTSVTPRCAPNRRVRCSTLTDDRLGVGLPRDRRALSSPRPTIAAVPRRSPADGWPSAGVGSPAASAKA